ncbi:MAG: putative transrane anti-sigma factor [Candidatus Solibacter sp.]|jgi:anti-sigma factor RsiW|nr:putative transrane anti-sigma factor [Candidatus Solibacter sp.]
MNCAELEILICDYVDGTLSAGQKTVVESHLNDCPACAELARDSAEAVAFMERAADVEPPAELITRILFDAPRVQAKISKAERGWLGRLLAPVIQPRFVMGAAMTVLSFSMLTRFVPVRQLKPADLRPSEVWASLDDRSHRAWARTVKYYENLKVVYQIQTLLRDWQQQSEDRKPSAPEQPKTDDRKLPVKALPQDGRPIPNPSGGSR